MSVSIIGEISSGFRAKMSVALTTLPIETGSSYVALSIERRGQRSFFIVDSENAYSPVMSSRLALLESAQGAHFVGVPSPNGDGTFNVCRLNGVAVHKGVNLVCARPVRYALYSPGAFDPKLYLP